MAYVISLYHIVIRTKYSIMAINESHELRLYKYIGGMVTNKNGILYNINGMPDHVHMLISLPPTWSVSEFIKVLKGETSKWIKQSGLFPEFKGWGTGYAAISYNIMDKDMIDTYISRQKSHHKRDNFAKEYKELLESNGINDPEYLSDP